MNTYNNFYDIMIHHFLLKVKSLIINKKSLLILERLFMFFILTMEGVSLLISRLMKPLCESIFIIYYFFGQVNRH